VHLHPLHPPPSLPGYAYGNSSGELTALIQTAIADKEGTAVSESTKFYTTIE